MRMRAREQHSSSATAQQRTGQMPRERDPGPWPPEIIIINSAVHLHTQPPSNDKSCQCHPYKQKTMTGEKRQESCRPPFCSISLH